MTVKLGKLAIGLILILLTSCSNSTAPDDTEKPINSPDFPRENPLGVSPENIPQFIILGFDDNPELTQGLIDSLSKRVNGDGSHLHASFYSNTMYSDNKNWGDMHRAYLAAGFEIGMHTDSHISSNNSSQDVIEKEILKNRAILADSLGVSESTLTGFRTPYLEANDKVMVSIENLGLAYDCSIEEGYQGNRPGDYVWPYKLGNGASPSWDKIRKFGWMLDEPINSHPNIWEIPVYTWQLPADSDAVKYNLPLGFRDTVQAHWDSQGSNWTKDFAKNGWKIEGFDYNVWEQYGFTADQFTNLLKFNFDKIYSGNRSPITLGLHSIYYGKGVNSDLNINTDKALFDFIDYAISKPNVKFISAKELIDWLNNPTEL